LGKCYGNLAKLTDVGASMEGRNFVALMSTIFDSIAFAVTDRDVEETPLDMEWWMCFAVPDTNGNLWL
jgi:hypothetical protein